MQLDNYIFSFNQLPLVSTFLQFSHFFCAFIIQCSSSVFGVMFCLYFWNSVFWYKFLYVHSSVIAYLNMNFIKSRFSHFGVVLEMALCKKVWTKNNLLESDTF